MISSRRTISRKEKKKKKYAPISDHIVLTNQSLTLSILKDRLLFRIEQFLQRSTFRLVNREISKNRRPISLLSIIRFDIRFFILVAWFPSASLVHFETNNSTMQNIARLEYRRSRFPSAVCLFNCFLHHTHTHTHTIIYRETILILLPAD